MSQCVYMKSMGWRQYGGSLESLQFRALLLMCPAKNNFLLPTNHGNVSVCMCGVATMRMLPELSEKMLTFLGFRQFIYEMAGINCVCIYVSIF